MTKQEKIKEAYGEHWDKVCEYVDENGIVSMIIDNIFVTPNFKDLGFTREFVDESIMSWYDSDKNTHFWQLKSLKGIEDNNGWINIESAEDLPNQSCSCWIQVKYQYTNTPFWYDFTKKCFSFKGIILFPNEVTHYKVNEQPKPPIY